VLLNSPGLRYYAEVEGTSRIKIWLPQDRSYIDTNTLWSIKYKLITFMKQHPSSTRFQSWGYFKRCWCLNETEV